MNWKRLSEIALAVSEKKLKTKTKQMFDRVIDGLQNGNMNASLGFARAVCDLPDADMELMKLAGELERLPNE